MLSETVKVYWTNASILHDTRYPETIRNTAAQALGEMSRKSTRLRGPILHDLQVEVEKLKQQAFKDVAAVHGRSSGDVLRALAEIE